MPSFSPSLTYSSHEIYSVLYSCDKYCIASFFISSIPLSIFWIVGLLLSHAFVCNYFEVFLYIYQFENKVLLGIAVLVVTLFLFWIFILFLFNIIFTFQSLVSPFHLRGWGSPGYPPTLTHQVSAGLGASSPTEAGQGALFENGFPQSGNSFMDSPYSSCWGIHMEIELYICYICPGDLGPAMYALWLVSGSFQDLRPVDTVALYIALCSLSWPSFLPLILQ